MYPLVEVLPYMLPDEGMMKTHANQVLVWRVPNPCIVLGQSNQLMESVDAQLLVRDRIPLYRRPSGGQAVLLSPRTVQVTVVMIERKLTNPLRHFERINRFMADLIEEEIGLPLFLKGISDLATEDERKLLGSSMYRNHGRVAYHGVLNLGEEASLIGRYLLHPPQEPDYRRGRGHIAFITSLQKQIPDLDGESFFVRFKNRMEHEFFSVSPDGFI